MKTGYRSCCRDYDADDADDDGDDNDADCDVCLRRGGLSPAKSASNTARRETLPIPC